MFKVYEDFEDISTTFIENWSDDKLISAIRYMEVNYTGWGYIVELLKRYKSLRERVNTTRN